MRSCRLARPSFSTWLDPGARYLSMDGCAAVIGSPTSCRKRIRSSTRDHSSRRSTSAIESPCTFVRRAPPGSYLSLASPAAGLPGSIRPDANARRFHDHRRHVQRPVPPVCSGTEPHLTGPPSPSHNSVLPSGRSGHLPWSALLLGLVVFGLL